VVVFLKYAETRSHNPRQRSSQTQEHETNVKIRVLEKQIDEHKAREAQLKQGNKSLRDELRKVQSSAALLERQRNPGVGYWGTRAPGSASGSGDAVNDAVAESRVSTSSADSVSSPSTKTDEEVNLEYVRNVVLQFLEHKERRVRLCRIRLLEIPLILSIFFQPQLVKVLSIILHLSPQETRRLMAKV
jgi:hypothetical protein